MVKKKGNEDSESKELESEIIELTESMQKDYPFLYD